MHTHTGSLLLLFHIAPVSRNRVYAAYIAELTQTHSPISTQTSARTGATPTDYNDDHILALEEFLGDILRSNTILPSCSDVIFPSGDMFANFSFELE